MSGLAIIKNKTLSVAMAVGALALAPFCALGAEFKDVVPGMSNAVATVNVKGLLASPLAQKESWQGKLMGGYADRPLAIPAMADHFGLAAFLEVPTLSPMWQLAVIDSTAPIDLGKVASTQKGTIDQVEGRTAVTTRFNVMHVQLASNRVGTLWPAQRQLATRILEKDGVIRGASAYLAAALAPDAEHQVTMALDLDQAFSGASIRQKMAMGGLVSLDSIEDIRALSDGLAKVRGVTVKAKVGSAVELSIAADFAGPVPLKPAAAKPFCLEVLSAVGLPAEQFENLSFDVKGNTITASGEAPLSAVGAMLGLLVPDTTNSVAEPTTASAASPTNAAATASDAASASLQYYKSVSGVLDRLSANQSMSSNATALRGVARQIQQLPVLNVDPELLVWGSTVVDMLSKCGMILAAGQTSAQNASASVESPVAEASYTETGYGGNDTSASRAAFRNAQQERRRLAQEARLQASQQAFQVISDAAKERAAIRARMAQKYGVEF